MKSVPRFLIVCVFALLASVCTAADPSAEQVAFFESEVRPILVNRCYDCHSEDSVESELRVDSLGELLEGGTRGPAIVPGEPKQSLLISAVEHSGQLYMPPKDKLPRAEIAALTKWIADGAVWPGSESVKPREARDPSGPLFTDEDRNFWAFQTPVLHELPSVSDDGWIRSPIDALVLSRLDEAGLSPAPPADNRTLIRRATFDLIGLPPTPEEVEAFLADDSDEAFARVIERLLASPQYGVRWGRHWLDIARYADSNGLDENLAYANAYRYRDYVVSAFNSDKPYDRFVQEQIAGDLLPTETDEARLDAIAATGFLCIGAKMLAEDDPMKMQMDIIDEQVDTIGRAFMGLTFGCARCHDHKFDPIPIADYYSLAGIFKSTKTMENFNVVARWQERPLATADQESEFQAIEASIASQKTLLNELVSNANEQLLTEARQHVGTYLLAAERQRRLEQMVADAAELDEVAGTKSTGGIVQEAEDFAHGNVLTDRSSYGKDIGVILNKGELPNFAAYEIEIPITADYQLALRYAAAQARPCRLSINGEVVKPDAASQVTGSWNPDTQRWHSEGVYRLQAGKNNIRLHCDGPFPHFDKLLLKPLDDDDLPALWIDADGDKEAYTPRPTFVQQWVNFLAEQTDDAMSPFAAWQTLATTGDLPVTADEPQPKTLTELAERYQRVSRGVEQAWQEYRQTEEGKAATSLPDGEQEALRHILHDEKGPFALPKKADALYEPEVRERVTAERQQLKSLQDSLPVLPTAMAVSDGTSENIPIHIRGSHQTLGDIVPRQFPQIMAGEEQSPLGDTNSGRLELAQWLTSPVHPLTSRVMVNRIWQWHFGDGLVRTPDNFGKLGERPTHPELLDWLAVQFVDEGWSIKAMHRLIMLSSTYQMSTTYDAVAAEQDPENRLLWRRSRQRLDAESIRDSLLFVAGNLDFSMGGTLLPTENRKYVTSTANVNPVVYDTQRRSMYLPIVRSALYEVFQAFDFADPAVSSGERMSTTVAPQALFMMNSEIVSKQSLALAERLLSRDATDPARVVSLYKQTLSRPPMDEETESALAYVRQLTEMLKSKDIEESKASTTAWQSLCRAVLSSNEYLYVE
ncbi:MAG: DUF1553 domain-containing protein [Planctomycetaceae bacterium]|nr:DUF1553 domain-containing protein [Planctomycetaceae bacterium]